MGTALRAMREGCGLTLRQAATLARIRRQSLARWERAATVPPSLVRWLAGIYGREARR